MKVKTLKSTFFLAFGVTVLTACMNVEADLKLDSKALASGEYKVTIEKSIAAMMGITDEESFKTFLTTQEGSDLSSEEISVVDSGSSYVMTAKVSDYPLADDDMSATVMPDGRIKFVFSQEGNTDESTIEVGGISLKIEFPGDISELSPEFQKVDSRNALLALPMSTPVSGAYVISETGETAESDSGAEEATSSGSDGNSNSMLIILLSVLVLLVGGGIVLKKKNSGKSDSGSSGDVDAAS
jgi:hypothetical protein